MHLVVDHSKISKACCVSAIPIPIHERYYLTAWVPSISHLRPIPLAAQSLHSHLLCLPHWYFFRVQLLSSTRFPHEVHRWSGSWFGCNTNNRLALLALVKITYLTWASLILALLYHSVTIIWADFRCTVWSITYLMLWECLCTNWMSLVVVLSSLQYHVSNYTVLHLRNIYKWCIVYMRWSVQFLMALRLVTIVNENLYFFVEVDVTGGSHISSINLTS